MLNLGLILCVLLGCLTACSAKPCPPARSMLPPVVLMQEVPEPRLRGRTNGDLLSWSLDLREALRLANSDKAELRRWAGNLEQ